MSRRSVSQALLAAGTAWSGSGGLIVALSGGIDSVVLLHALIDLKETIGRHAMAIHVNHGLVDQAGEWQDFCRDLCLRYAIPYEAISVSVANTGSGPEAAARQARYKAMESRMGAEDIVLTAHHADDQAETVLLHALRGAGPHGLSAMAPVRRFGPGWLARPLLNLCRADIEHYAVQYRLRWVEDGSNESGAFTRNRIRRGILPALNSLAHGSSRALARSARLQAQAACLLDEVAAEDLAAVSNGDAAVLDCARLTSLSLPRRRNLVRFWLATHQVPTLHEAQMETLEYTVIGAAPDRQPELRWAGFVLRRYRGMLYLHRDLAIGPLPQGALRFSPPRELVLPVGCLRVAAAVGNGVRRDLDFSVRFRRGGESLRPVGDTHRRTLKHLFQSHGVPPWRRSTMPLVYVGDRLAAVPGICIAREFAAAKGQPAWWLEWAHSADE